MKSLLSILLFVVLGFPIYAQTLFVNEVLSSNKGVIKDKFGNSDDCIEIFNSAASDKDLSGFYLSDSKDSLK